MSFLDNSGGIILDVVLTDAGAKRLAKGDGSFNITKFALFDDEIDYGAYNASHSSGSAYYDLELLQFPVLEALVNNTSTAKSKLISIARNDIIYLPILKLAEVFESSVKKHSSGAYLLAVDEETEVAINKVNGSTVDGVMNGETLSGGSYIRVDQGIDSTEIPPSYALPPDLYETQYIIEIDNSLGTIASRVDGKVKKPSYIDDDNIASYYYSLGNDNNFVKRNPETNVLNNQTITGPRGSFLQFVIQASIELNTSTARFVELGNKTVSLSTGDSGGTVTALYIDTNIKITGITTGASINIPVRFVKKTS